MKRREFIASVTALGGASSSPVSPPWVHGPQPPVRSRPNGYGSSASSWRWAKRPNMSLPSPR